MLPDSPRTELTAIVHVDRILGWVDALRRPHLVGKGRRSSQTSLSPKEVDRLAGLLFHTTGLFAGAFQSCAAAVAYRDALARGAKAVVYSADSGLTDT